MKSFAASLLLSSTKTVLAVLLCDIYTSPWDACSFCWGNWKQWKWKLETENGNSQNLMQMNARVKPLINDHLQKITSIQDHLCAKTT